MKLRKEIGNESVRDIILEARARAAELPYVDIRDPWPNDRLLDVGAVVVKTESTLQDT
jgi:hypothetical protein